MWLTNLDYAQKNASQYRHILRCAQKGDNRFIVWVFPSAILELPYVLIQNTIHPINSLLAEGVEVLPFLGVVLGFVAVGVAQAYDLMCLDCVFG
jgi:hypothetical protein